jgi:hypothetical protein
MKIAVSCQQPFLLVVHGESFNHIFLQMLVGPYPELRAALAPYPETDGQYHIERVEFHVVLLTVGGSY